MADIRHIHRYMSDRRRVQLSDGRIGRVTRVDTEFPGGATTVSIWIDTEKGPGVTKVDLVSVIGPVKDAASA